MQFDISSFINKNSGIIDRVIKRAFDILIAGTALVLLSPVLAAVWIVVRARMGKPALFRQQRPGLGGRPFTLIKFRTMTNLAPTDDPTGSDSKRLTPLGSWLRASSLDELPELWNVLVGDMSLVGPRPLLTSYLPLYSPEEARRHDVRPGITGWAQVKGRNSLSWGEKFSLDVWYVDNQSMWLDLKIIALTAYKVVMRADIAASGEATMPKFDGTNRHHR